MKKRLSEDRLRQRISLFKKICREQGIKVTPQRIEIFLAIADSVDHPSAEDVYERVRDRLHTVSLDTVYRTLTTFEQCRLVSRIQFVAERIRFDPNMQTHHHLYCTECNSITDFYWPDFDGTTLPPEVLQWGDVESRQVQVRGLCSECLRKKTQTGS